jgi:hypothetical protein
MSYFVMGSPDDDPTPEAYTSPASSATHGAPLVAEPQLDGSIVPELSNIPAPGTMRYVHDRSKQIPPERPAVPVSLCTSWPVGEYSETVP